MCGVFKNMPLFGLSFVSLSALQTFQDAEVTHGSCGTPTQLPDPRTFPHRTLLTCITLTHTHTHTANKQFNLTESTKLKNLNLTFAETEMNRNKAAETLINYM